MKKFILLLGILTVFFFASNPVFAAHGASHVESGSTGAPLVSTKLENPIKYDTFYDFVEAVIKTAVKILMPFVVIAFMISGFLFIKAQGNAEEISKAKTAMWFSIVGAFILLGSLGFAQIIGKTVKTLAP